MTYSRKKSQLTKIRIKIPAQFKILHLNCVHIFQYPQNRPVRILNQLFRMLLSFFIIRVPLCRAELTLQHDLLELGLFYFFPSCINKNNVKMYYYFVSLNPRNVSTASYRKINHVFVTYMHITQ